MKDRHVKSDMVEDDKNELGMPHVKSIDKKMPWSDHTLSSDFRAESVVQEMTQDEKFSWLSGVMAIPISGSSLPDGAIGSAAYYPGIPRLGICAQQQTDASLGVGNLANVRPGDNATALPSSLLLGATFNPAMAYETGALVGREARAKGFTVQLAGGANVVREARGGRNFEYVSEDPLLTGVIAGNSVAGIQSQGVVSTIKHFAVNSQETGRVLANSVLELPALHESDLLAFKIAIEIGEPGSVMPGYNLVNGEWATENAYLLNTVLKGEWGYPGWVMSDWGATHSTEKAALSGLDVQSGSNLDPMNFFGQALRLAVSEGRVPQSRIDEMVRRQLRSLFAVGVLDKPPIAGAPIDFMAHRILAQRAAQQGIVLLKNSDAVLPLKKRLQRLLVIGRHADTGVLAGGGSSAVSPVGCLKTEGAKFMGTVLEKIYHPSSPLHAITAEGEAEKVDFVSGANVKEAVHAASESDAVILFVEAWRSEGQDVPDLSLPDDQDALIAAVASANPNTIVVLQTGGAVIMPWLEDVAAVLSVFFPGSGGAEAIAGILFGRVNPSGRLPITFPQDVTQLPRPDQRDPATTTSNPGEKPKGGVFDIDHNIEGSDVGYRWFDREKQIPSFCFGFGLSYTQFDYSNFHASPTELSFTAELHVQNIGALKGATVLQLYVSLNGENGFVSRLASFERVELDPGEARDVSLRVDPRLLASFDADTRQWIIAPGNYQVRVAENAAATGQTVTISLSRGVVKA